MSGEQYALLAYVVGVGLVAAYSARLWVMHRGLRREERREAAGVLAPGDSPVGLGSLRVESPVRVDVRRAGEAAGRSAHV
jgi:hypothetical protein